MKLYKNVIDCMKKFSVKVSAVITTLAVMAAAMSVLTAAVKRKKK